MPPIAQVKVNELTLKNGSNLLSSYSNGTFAVNTTTQIEINFKAIIVNAKSTISEIWFHETNVISDYIQNPGNALNPGSVIVARPGVNFEGIKLTDGQVTLVL
jgi:hypothetical protein